MSNFSPLRYPGGKSRAVDFLKKYIPDDCKELCSPFFGGGSFELFCANNGIKVNGYDVFKPLIVFWQELLENKDLLTRKILSYYPLDKNKFYELQKKQFELENKNDIASIFYVLNRASFSGSTFSGGMSPGHPRFTVSSIDKIKNFNIKNFNVKELSFDKSIAKHKNIFLYLDPPYMIKNTLYGNRGDAHKGFNHNLLREVICEHKYWVMSYNNSPEIQDMYKEYKMIIPEWKYGMSNDKKSKEILIFSHEISKEKREIICQHK